MPSSHRFILAGKPGTSRQMEKVLDKYSGRTIARVALAGPKDVARAIAAGVRARRPMRQMPGFQRADVLHRLAALLDLHRDDFADLLCAEAGKPLRDARGEVDRALITCTLAAEEATRIGGEYLPLDISARSRGYSALTRRVPAGLCSFITPFNFPLNLVMHKIAPAIACGCPFILKPAPQTPLTALRLGELLVECGEALPHGAFSILPLRNDDAAPLVEDERIALLSFTGSAAVGWSLKSRAGKKKVALELGGNAACIVDEGVDVALAADRITFGAFYQSGQSCISVQRLLVHESMYRRMKRELVRRAAALQMGDPRREQTVLGPLISSKDVDRLLEWIHEAKGGGAEVICGGTTHDLQRSRRGRGKRGGAGEARFLTATIVENPPRDSRLWREEAFGPVLTIERFRRFDDALALANDSRYGLQTGVFTNDFEHALRAWDVLEAGGVVINDVPSARVDAMPYGGVKDSGLGREGVRSAIAEMTEPRVMLLRRSSV